ncbi:hypothetical protein ANN_13181 [Periplaneta americana]|uniref:Reverse transcriptase domain-containing protein n=1 Tax=Periplaneta americana TaxID=6978 RepID=A0ABQ8TIU0_PERAM|nr:hypothetical protein ANN_13181 [Periplaneta americana]
MMNNKMFYEENMGGVIVGGRRIKSIKFADDLALLAEEEAILRDMLLEINDICEQYGMKINANKTKTIKTIKKIHEESIRCAQSLNIVPEDALFHKNEHFLNVTKIRNLLRNREFDIWCRHPEKGKDVVLFKQYPGANKWICKHEGHSNSEWRDGIKMVGNVAAVRAVSGRSQDNRCRHCHNEVETLAHVLGSCPHGEALRNARHHQVRSIIATALKDADYNTFEEVHGLSVTGSTRRIDIIAFKESTRSGYIIDPTVRFETDEEQPAELDNEKKEYLQSYHSLLPQKIPAKRA